MDPKQVWQAVLGELQLQMTRATFDTWLKNTHVVSADNGLFVIGAPNTYAVQWLENRLLSAIQRSANRVAGRSVELRFVVHTPGNGNAPTGAAALISAEAASQPYSAGGNGRANHLNPKYTFETFIVGHSNRLAQAACLAVAQKPAEAYNPLFVYGGVGLGKTHLLHAIGHACVAKSLCVLYVSSEKFTNDLINSIGNQTTEEFRETYRNPDLLLIDDIQFIAGKERTQEEFFHTFNALLAANRQVVISSDRPPKSIPTLEERLRSRFEGGLIVDIQPPDLETRIAILRFKAESQPIPIPAEVLNLIAQRVPSNIRELEGASTRVVAYAQITNSAITPEFAAKTLDQIISRHNTRTLNDVIEVTARFYNVPAESLRGASRNKRVTLPRQVSMYLARQETSASLPEIGQALGGRDHTTVMHGVEKITRELESDETLRRQVLAVREMLYSGVSA